jgi:hypothetical protein
MNRFDRKKEIIEQIIPLIEEFNALQPRDRIILIDRTTWFKLRLMLQELTSCVDEKIENYQGFLREKFENPISSRVFYQPELYVEKSADLDDYRKG